MKEYVFKVYQYTFRGSNLFTYLLPISRGIYSQRKEFTSTQKLFPLFPFIKTVKKHRGVPIHLYNHKFHQLSDKAHSNNYASLENIKGTELKMKSVLRCMGLFFFPPCFQRETIFMPFCLLTWRTKSSQNGVYSEGKEFAPRGAYSFL